MKIEFKTEKPEDYRAVEALTREAFWNHYGPGCDEHYFAHRLRDTDVFVKELDTNAVVDGKIVGNIMYSRSHILKDDGETTEVLCFGPLSVLPEYQGKGVGTGLIEYTKELAVKLGYKAILIYGDPEFYKRTGFVSAESFGIADPDHMYVDALQACELEEGALSGCSGYFYEDSGYVPDEKKTADFDEGFQFQNKEKRSGLPSQERFLELAGRRKPRVRILEKEG